MMKKHWLIIFIFIIAITISRSAIGSGLAPDKSQQVLDFLAVECQKINDYYMAAQAGNTSNHENVKRQMAVSINNISILMNGYDNSSINTLWNMYNEFAPDAASALRAMDICSSVRSEIYKKISNDKNLSNPQTSLNSFDDCVKAGYHVNGNTCFIGGTSIYDQEGNLIGFYYADCFDNQGFHMGSCWDCYYGADNEGCIEKP